MGKTGGRTPYEDGMMFGQMDSNFNSRSAMGLYLSNQAVWEGLKICLPGMSVTGIYFSVWTREVGRGYSDFCIL